MQSIKKFYVSKETAKGEVIGFAVCDRVGGLESVHAQYKIRELGSAETARQLAQDECNRLNAGGRPS